MSIVIATTSISASPIHVTTLKRKPIASLPKVRSPTVFIQQQRNAIANKRYAWCVVRCSYRTWLPKKKVAGWNINLVAHFLSPKCLIVVIVYYLDTTQIEGQAWAIFITDNKFGQRRFIHILRNHWRNRLWWKFAPPKYIFKCELRCLIAYPNQWACSSTAAVSSPARVCFRLLFSTVIYCLQNLDNETCLSTVKPIESFQAGTRLTTLYLSNWFWRVSLQPHKLAQQFASNMTIRFSLWINTTNLTGTFFPSICWLICHWHKVAAKVLALWTTYSYTPLRAVISTLPVAKVTDGSWPRCDLWRSERCLHLSSLSDLRECSDAT